MLSKTAINIIRKSICNNARMFYGTQKSLHSNFLMFYGNKKQYSVQNYCNLYIARFKSSRKKESRNKDEESDEEEVDDYEIPVGSKVHVFNILSIRLDAISKAGFGLSRNKIEEMFYESKFRINGNKVLKKSMEVKEGDEIDLILHKDINNPKFLVVNRIVILSMSPTTKESIQIKLCRDKNLLIENYENPYNE